MEEIPPGPQMETPQSPHRVCGFFTAGSLSAGACL